MLSGEAPRIVLLGATAISLGLASPALAAGPKRAPDNAVVQRQSADLSNETEQKAVAVAPAVQIAPAVNLGVLNFGGQKINQANSNSSNAEATKRELDRPGGEPEPARRRIAALVPA
jgi:hypothetical protein